MPSPFARAARGFATPGSPFLATPLMDPPPERESFTMGDFASELARGGAEGALTGMLGAPVDLATMIMRPFGYRTEKPVMSSGWIRDLLSDGGVYQPRSGSGPEATGEFLGALAAPGPDPLQYAALSLGLPAMMGAVSKVEKATAKAAVPVRMRTPGKVPPSAEPYVEKIEKVTAPFVIPKGEMWTPGSLFDYRNLSRVPDTPQFDLPRLAPPKGGYPDWLTQVDTPANVKKIKGYIEKGLKLGGPEWYNTEPIRLGFIEELGEEAGNAAHRLFADMMAVSSPLNPVPSNVKTASLLLQRARGGMRTNVFPSENINPKTGKPYRILEPELLEGYGGVGQADWINSMNEMLERGFIDPMQYPKTSSFSEDIAGNWQPYTVDRHDIASSGLPEMTGRGDKLKSIATNLYPFLEQFGQGIARQMGLPSAVAQASRWFGASTGVRSPVEPLLRTFERRVEYTANQRGEKMTKVLRDFYRGKAPLLGVGGMTAMLYRTLIPEDMVAGSEDEDGS